MTSTCVSSIVVAGLVALGQPAANPPRQGVVLGEPARAFANVSIAADGDVVAAAWTARDARGTDVVVRTFDADLAPRTPLARVNPTAYESVPGAERPPRIAIASVGGRRTIAVLWLGTAPRPDAGAAGPAPGLRLLLSLSHDDGHTFAAPIAVSAVGAPGIRGWSSLAASRDGAWHATWLDGRDAVTASGGAASAGSGHTHHHHGAGPAAPAAAPGAAPGPVPPRRGAQQDLYHAVIAADGSVREARVASDVCFCCKTATLPLPAAFATVATPGDLAIAWRHIYPGSERDIALTVRNPRSGAFAPPVRVSADRWQLQACPDDGPALAASGTGSLHAVWPTLAEAVAGRQPEKGIYHARSTDGRTFTPRRRLDRPGGNAGHPQVAADAEGRAYAVWDEAADGGGRRVVAISLAEPSDPRAVGPGTHPVIVATANGFVAAWTTGSGEQTSISLARIP